MMTQKDIENYTYAVEKLYESHEDILFINDGAKLIGAIAHIFYDNTKDVVRLYWCGHREMVACDLYYWGALTKYLMHTDKKIMVLLDNEDEIKKGHIQVFNKEKLNRQNDTISVKLITEDDKTMINDTLIEEYCSFEVFDNNMFRFEYKLEGYKGYCSFNKPKTCELLIKVFDKAFNNKKAKIII